MSITSEMSRINTALDAVEDGKEAIADALTAKGVDTMPDASFDTLATNVGLIESGGGGGGGNMQRTRVLSVILTDDKDYPLDTPLYSDGLEWLEYRVKRPDGESYTANTSIWTGFDDSPTPIYAEYYNQFNLVVRSGSPEGITMAKPPCTEFPVGWHAGSGTSSYSIQGGVSYSRNLKNVSTYWHLHPTNNATQFIGSRVDIYAYYKV